MSPNWRFTYLFYLLSFPSFFVPVSIPKKQPILMTWVVPILQRLMLLYLSFIKMIY